MDTIYQYGDVTLLRHARHRGVPTHPWVRLDRNELSRIGDPLHAVGFYDLELGGAGTSLKYESHVGESGTSRIKLAEGQIRYGMSGGLLYNRRTGLAVGMIMFSRDVHSALGGVGIDARVISSLMAQVGTVPEYDTRWETATLQGDAELEEQPRDGVSATRHDVLRHGGVPFVRRNREWVQLCRFLRSSGTFGWCTVVGPGGIGKSRLALELAAAHEPEWQSIFLSDCPRSTWQKWTPIRPTLLIADDFDNCGDGIRHMLRDCGDQSARYRVPVRLLCLGRAIDDAVPEHRRESLGIIGAADLANEFPTTRFAEACIELTELGPSEVSAIVTTRLPQSVPADRVAAIVEAIQSMPATKSPLFVMFAADAAAEGRDVSQWGPEKVLDSHLRREKKRWHAGGVTAADRALLVLATIVGGIPLDSAWTADTVPYLPDATRYVPERQTLMTGAVSTDRAAPLRPDVVAEYFVLHEMRRVATIDRRPVALAMAAWRYDAWATLHFLLRCEKGFPASATLDSLREALAVPPSDLVTETDSKDHAIISSWLSAICVSAEAYAERGDPDRMLALYKSIRQGIPAGCKIPGFDYWGLVEVVGETCLTLATALRLSEAFEVYDYLRDSVSRNAVPLFARCQARCVQRLMDMVTDMPDDEYRVAMEVRLKAAYGDLRVLMVKYGREKDVRRMWVRTSRRWCAFLIHAGRGDEEIWEAIETAGAVLRDAEGEVGIVRDRSEGADGGSAWRRGDAS